MNDKEKQICQAWCKINGITIHKDGDLYYITGPWWIGSKIDFYKQTENKVYEAVWTTLKPWLDSIRNLDTQTIIGPYEARPSGQFNDWEVTNEGSVILSRLNESTAKIVATTLNREVTVW